MVMKKKKQQQIIGFVIIALVVVALLSVRLFRDENGSSVKNAPAGEVTLSGHETCLPVKRSEKNDIEECVLGFKAGLGKYYVLEIASDQRTPAIANGATFVAHGTVRDEKQMGDTPWSRVNVDGVFFVEEVVSVEE